MTQVTVAGGTAGVHPLVERITRMRGRVRAVVGLFGVGALVAAAVGGMIVLMLGDYLLHFSGATRVVLLLLWLAALGVVAWRVLINPLSTRLTDQFLASRVENVHKDLQDELISAVHFIHAGTIRTNALAARHVDSAAAKTAGIKFEKAVDFRRTNKALGIGAFVVLVAAILFAANPVLGGIAVSRWFTPNGADWPRTTKVMFVWATEDGKAPSVIPVGEKLVVRAKVVQGGYAEQRVWLTTWGDNDSPRSELMTYQPSTSSGKEFVYERPLEPQGEKSFSMKVEAGDDTEQEAVKLRLAARPLITEVQALIAPPAYVKDVRDASKAAPAVHADLMTQKGRAVEGATVTLRIRSTKEFLKGADGRPEVKLLAMSKETDVAPGMARKLVEKNLAEVSFPATASWEAHVVMRDVDGFENHAGGTVSLGVVPDVLPSVIITEPRRMTDRTPTASVDVAIQATDDLGLDGVKLVVQKFDAKEGEILFETPLKWADLKVDAASGNTTGTATFKWELGPLNLQPGTRLTFYAAVQDNYDVDGKRHPWVKSVPLTLQIKSDSEIAKAAREQLNEIKDRIKVLKGEQERTKSLTDAIQKSAAEAGVTTAQQKEQLAQLAQQENQQAATANSIQKKVEDIKNDLAANKMGENDLGKLARDVSEGMKDVGQNNMPKAASELNKAHESAGNQDPKEKKQDEKSKAEAQQTADSAKNASKQQGEAIAKMNSMIDQLGAAGDLAAHQQAIRDLKEKQDKLAEKTHDLSTKTVGKKPEELSKNEKEQLDQLSKEQSELEQKTRDEIKDLQDSSRRAQQNDPAAAESMAKAAQAGKESDVPGSQKSASADIKKNQMNNASGSQGQASSGLQQMADELNKNEKRALEQLQRQLAELIAELKKLKAAEEAINKDTVAAGEKGAAAALTKIGDKQGSLQMNTIVVQKKTENTKDGQKPAQDVRDAAEQMGLAAVQLLKAHQPESTEPEGKAIEFLAAAIDKLEKAKQKVDEQLKKNELADFIKKYEAIRTAERTIKETSDQVEKAKQAAEDKEISRNDERRLAAMAKSQGEQLDLIAKLSSDEKLKEYDVIVWMNGQITQAMTASKEKLSKAQTGRQLAAAQQTAIDRITDIIDALKEEKDKSEFEQGSNSGGGGGGGGKKPLLPPVAQLKLVRAMQNIVNKETVDANKALQTAGTDAEKSELKDQVGKIGKTQEELKGVVKKIIDEMH